MINSFFKKIKSTKLNISNVLVIILSLIIAFAAVYKWFSNGTILYYWDANLPLDISNSFQDFFFYWHSNVFPGGSGNGWSWLPYWASIAILSRLFSSLSLAQGLLYVSLVFFSIFNFYLLLNYLFETLLDLKKNLYISRLVSFLFAVFYSLNLYTFYYQYFMFNPQAYIHALLPLNILALLKLFPFHGVYKDASIRWIFIFFLTIIFMTAGFTTYIFLAEYILSIFLYLSLKLFLSRNKFISFNTIKTAVFLILVLIINWWWFFPSLLTFKDLFARQGTIGTNIYFDLSSINSYLLNSVRLLGTPMMNNNPFSWDSFYNTNNLFTVPLFLFLFLIIYLLKNIRALKNHFLVVYFLLIFLITLFIIKLGNPPFAWITKFAFENIPFFGAFRDAYQKAGLYYVFVYFILSGLGFSLLIKKIQDKGNKFLLRLSFLLLLVVGIIVTGPFFLFSYDNIKKIDFEYNGKKYNFSAKTRIPEEYYQIKSVLEENCGGTTVLVLPRTSSISDGVWTKYGTSYVGQDMLSHLIGCNFISTHLLQNEPDSFNTSPYLMLQDSDFLGFKKFLLQNQIGLVLIRKDYVPYYYTLWSYVDPAYAITLLNSDSDFNKRYENDFFVVFSLNDLKRDRSFGFALPSSIAFTNSSLNYARDYQILSNALGKNKGSLVITNLDSLSLVKPFINTYLSVGNCIGCIKIDQSSSLDISKEDQVANLKKNIKHLLGMDKEIQLSEENKISNSVLESNYNFRNLMSQIKNKNDVLIKKHISEYVLSFENIKKLIENFKGSFFDKNYKMIEVNNFLIAQKNTLLRAYFEGKSSDYLEESQYRGEFTYLLSLQDSYISYLNKNIWQTDYENKIYKTRLDISYPGEYNCSVYTSSKELHVVDISINDTKNGIKIKSDSGMYKFPKGNYPVTLKYSVDQIIHENLIEIESSGLIERSLKKIKDGKYKIKFEKEKSIDNANIIVGVTKRKIDSRTLQKIRFPQENFIFFENLSKNVRSIKDDRFYEGSFSINSAEQPNYYLYFFLLDSSLANNSIRQFKNLSIEKIVEDGDIYFSCVLNTKQYFTSSSDKMNVKKINPTLYTIELPNEYKKGFLTFNQTYGKDWEAYTMISGKKHKYYHLKNSYANGWYIDNPGNRKVVVEYTKQNLVVKNAVLTIVVFIIVLCIYIRLDKKNEKNV